MDRRSFLRIASAGAGLPAIGWSQFPEAARTPSPGVIDIGSTKQLFLDDYLVENLDRISWLQWRPQKYAKNPVLVAERPWEQGSDRDYGIQISGQSVIYDAEDKLFKMWYWANLVPGGDVANLAHASGDFDRHWCYAVSSDGYHWEKPDLGLIDFHGSTKNNLIHRKNWGGGDGYFNVMKDPHDPDPQRRYKALGWTWGMRKGDTSRGLIVAFSPDGIRWTDHPGNPVVPGGREIADVPTMLGWDDRLKKYVYYPRPGLDFSHHLSDLRESRKTPAELPDVPLRCIGYSESADFVHWSPTRIMLAPDREDRVDYQYYQITSALYGDYCICFLAMYETHEQSFEIFLLTSRGGFNWTWADRRVPFLRRGEVGSYDAGYMTPNGQILHNGQIWIFYGAYSGAHSFQISPRLGPDRCSIALATMPADRWLGLLAGPNRGTVLTKPVRFAGARFLTDFDASLPFDTDSEPRVRAALLDGSGHPLEQFSVEKSTVAEKSGMQEIAWNDADLSTLAGKPVRIHFELYNAALYSFQFA